jgi:hypothetical protein
MWLQHAEYEWNHSTILPIQRISELSTIPGYMEWLTASAYLTLYYIAVAWVLVFLGELCLHSTWPCTS